MIGSSSGGPVVLNSLATTAELPDTFDMNMKNITSTKKNLSTKQREELLAALKGRFEKNLNRHKGLDWAKVQARLEANPEKLWSLSEMERTGGEPDVVGVKSGEYVFFDCSTQSPKGRVSFCY